MTPPEQESPSASLPPVVRRLGWVSFFADVSSEMAYPLLPLFVVGALGAPVAALGLIEGGSQALVALLAFLSGRRSDRTRRRLPPVRWGYGLPVAGRALIALASGWPAVLAGRLVDRVGKGLRGSPRDALIVDATPPALLGRAFGFHRALDTAGACVGGLAAAWLIAVLAARGDAPAMAYRTAFAVAAALGLLAFLLTLRLREPGAPAAREVADGGAAARPAPRRAYSVTLAVLVVFAFANSSDTLLLLRATGLGLSAPAVVLAWTGCSLVAALLAYPAGRLSDRVGRHALLGLGWALYAAVYAGFALADGASPGLALALLGAYGVQLALVEGVGRALLADVVDPARRGAQLGQAALATGLASLAGSLLAGRLWDESGPRAAFLLGAGAATLALLLLPVAARAAAPREAAAG